MATGTQVLITDLDDGDRSVRHARDAAREFVRQAPGPAQSDETRHDVELVVSELVSNARRHAPGPYQMSLTSNPDTVTVAVHDCGPQWRTLPGQCRDGGYGLLLVRRLARTLQVRLLPEGKIVTATVPRQLPAATGP